MHRAPGAPRSEIKEEAKPGDIRGGEYPVAFAQALNSSVKNNSSPKTRPQKVRSIT
ncbi:hypothetical protein J2X92_005374 [Variovorax paradoxus]|nr:hypothetical protein [Variovorax paradoxus]